MIRKIFLIFVALANCSFIASGKEWSLNTSNPGKLEEFHRLFAKYGISLKSTSLNLKEIDAKPLLVAAHKASQMPEYVLVEDTSLEIEGIEIGIHLKTFFPHLLEHVDQYIGRKAAWIVILAYKEGSSVYLYQGIVKGTLIQPQEENILSFDSYFLPEGATRTLAEEKPEDFNARALAVKALMDQKPIALLPVILEWEGPWQH